MFATIHPLAIILAGLASMPIGMLWYGPLFGKTWAKLMGFSTASMDDSKKKMRATYAAQLTGTVVQAFVLSLMIFSSRVFELGQVMLLAFWLWLGFMATVIMTKQLFDTRPFNRHLYAIDAFYQLVVLEVMAIIIYLFL